MRTSTEWLRWCSRVSRDMAPGLPCLRLVLLVTITPAPFLLSGLWEEGNATWFFLNLLLAPSLTFTVHI